MLRKVVSAVLVVCMFVGCLCIGGNVILAGEVSRLIRNEMKTIQAEEQSVITTGAAVTIEAPSAILMEASTGTIIFEKASKEPLRPASITKIMTLILIFDAIEEGKIKLEDTVTTSEYAASMGGSQVFLEPNEQQTVDTMIKCIAVASANDACVA